MLVSAPLYFFVGFFIVPYGAGADGFHKNGHPDKYGDVILDILRAQLVHRKTGGVFHATLVTEITNKCAFNDGCETTQGIFVARVSYEFIVRTGAV